MKTNPDEPAELSAIVKFANRIWGAFLAVHVPVKPATIVQDAWDLLMTGENIPSYTKWEWWCDCMCVPFSSLLLFLATYESPRETTEARTKDNIMRLVLLRKFYGKVSTSYYPTLDALLRRKLPDDEQPLDASKDSDLRSYRKELGEARRVRWVELMARLKILASTPHPVELSVPHPVTIRPRHLDKRNPPPPPRTVLKILIDEADWTLYMEGQRAPRIEDAGLVGRALGIPYEEFYQVYTLEGLDFDVPNKARNETMLRWAFNKKWSCEDPGLLRYKAEFTQRRKEATEASNRERNATLLAYWKSVIERHQACVEAGDLRNAGIAKVEIRALDAQLTRLRLPHETTEEKMVTPIAAKAMLSNPVTGELEVVPTIHHKKRKSKADDYVELPQPPPPPLPPPPPPPAPFSASALAESKARAKQAEEDDTPGPAIKIIPYDPKAGFDGRVSILDVIKRHQKDPVTSVAPDAVLSL